MARKNIIEILIKADDKASKQFLAVGGNLQKLNQQITQGAQVTAAAGLAIGAALGAIIYKTAQHNDQIAKGAKQIGVTTEFLSEMEHAAKISGATQEDIMTGIKRLSKSASDASYGLETYVRSFNALGISVVDNRGKLKDSEALFMEVAEAISKVENDTQKAALAQELFGRGGLRLIPMLNMGASGIAKLRREAKALGISLDKDAAEGSENLIDSITRLKGSLRGLAITITDELDKPISDFIDRLAKDVIPKTGEWLKQNKDAISTSTKVGIGLTATSVGFLALNKAMAAATAHPFLAIFSAALAITIANLETAKARMRAMMDEAGKTEVLERGEKAIRDTAAALETYIIQAERSGRVWIGFDDQELVEARAKLQELKLAIRGMDRARAPKIELPELVGGLSNEEKKAREEATAALRDYEDGLIDAEEMQRRLNEAIKDIPDPNIPPPPPPPLTGEEREEQRKKLLEAEEAAIAELVKAYDELQTRKKEAAEGWIVNYPTMPEVEGPQPDIFEPAIRGAEQLRKLLADTVTEADDLSVALEDVPEIINRAAEEADRAADQIGNMFDYSGEDILVDLNMSFGNALEMMLSNAKNKTQQIERLFASMVSHIIVMLAKVAVWHFLILPLLQKGGEFTGAKTGLEFIGGQKGLELLGAQEGLQFNFAQRGLEAMSGQYFRDTIPVMITRGEVVSPSPHVERVEQFMKETEHEGGGDVYFITPFVTGSMEERLGFGAYSQPRINDFGKFVVRGTL